MKGIVSFGGYVPIWRLPREDIGKTLGTAPLRGERAVAGIDEDVITMGVEALLDALKGFERDKVRALFFATTSSPYREKQCASIISRVLDLEKSTFTADFGGSIRAGTNALRTAILSEEKGYILVGASDIRLGYAKRQEEQLFGDASGALILGDGDVVAKVLGMSSTYDEIMDVWRTEKFVQTWEQRWVITHGYRDNMVRAVKNLLSETNTKPEDINRVILSSPDMRSYQDVARSLGFDPKAQVMEPLILEVGNSGCAHPLLCLSYALELSEPGDKILLAGYGDGADAFLFEVTDRIKDLKDGRGPSGFIKSKKTINYGKYLLYRGLLETEEEVFNVGTASTVLWRDASWVYSLHASRCKRCGLLSFPIQRVCYGCGSKDEYEEERIYERRGKVFTYSLDQLAGSPEEPVVIQTILEIDGARVYVQMTDASPDEVKIGMDAELTFRVMRFDRGFYNYFWKARPVRKEGR